MVTVSTPHTRWSRVAAQQAGDARDAERRWPRSRRGSAASARIRALFRPDGRVEARNFPGRPAAAGVTVLVLRATNPVGPPGRSSEEDDRHSDRLALDLSTRYSAPRPGEHFTDLCGPLGRSSAEQANRSPAATRPTMPVSIKMRYGGWPAVILTR